MQISQTFTHERELCESSTMWLPRVSRPTLTMVFGDAFLTTIERCCARSMERLSGRSFDTGSSSTKNLRNLHRSFRKPRLRRQGNCPVSLSCRRTLYNRKGTRLYELARGIDHNPVVSNRVCKQISAEDTFPEDIPLAETEPQIRRLAEKVWNASRNNVRGARTVVLKLKTKEFLSLTRCLTPVRPPLSYEELAGIALSLRERVELSPSQLFRLVGVGLSNFQNDAEEPSPLFEAALADDAIQAEDLEYLSQDLAQ